jgi:hypothetical protein
MSIEKLIEANTAALEANTATMEKVLAAGIPTGTMVTLEEVKPEPAKKKAGRPPKAKLEPVTEEPAATAEEFPVDEPEVPVISDDELIKQIQETVKAKMTAPGADPKAVQDAWVAIRKSYGVDRMPDLKGKEGQLAAALADAKEM